jgi:xylan 1,4-beta-xylosidase
MGPWLANTIRQCDGLADMLSYWTLSDVFEEQGVVKQPFYGGYGLMAEGGLPKPAFNAFKLLHRLGTRRIEAASSSALITRRDNGTLAIAVWNLVLPEINSVNDIKDGRGASKEITIAGKSLESHRRAAISRVDPSHGSLLTAYEAMGRPPYPTREQIGKLRKAAELPPPEMKPIEKGRITLSVPPHGLVLIEID